MKNISKNFNCKIRDMLDIDCLYSDDELYVLVQWPTVKELMEYDWFKSECYLHQATQGQEYLNSAYFVPLSRLNQIE